MAALNIWHLCISTIWSLQNTFAAMGSVLQIIHTLNLEIFTLSVTVGDWWMSLLGALSSKGNSNMAPLKSLSCNVVSGFDLRLLKLQEWKSLCNMYPSVSLMKKSSSSWYYMHSVSVSFWSCVGITAVGRVLFIQLSQAEDNPAATWHHSSYLPTSSALWVKRYSLRASCVCVCVSLYHKAQR